MGQVVCKQTQMPENLTLTDIPLSCKAPARRAGSQRACAQAAYPACITLTRNMTANRRAVFVT